MVITIEKNQLAANNPPNQSKASRFKPLMD